MNAEQSNITQAVNDSEIKKQLPNGQPSCSNSAKSSNSKWPKDGESFGNIFSKAKARGKDEGYRIRNQDAIMTGTVRVEEARAGNANEGTGNQALTTGGRA